MDIEHPLTRQIRLNEVGLEGQAKLSAASLEVRGADGSLTEFVYLHRAGVERLSLLPNLSPRTFSHSALFRHAGTLRMAAGAWRAISQIRSILALDTVSR
jgi:molybdopterin/thiamine biosynthesis adenylyltransferase